MVALFAVAASFIMTSVMAQEDPSEMNKTDHRIDDTTHSPMKFNPDYKSQTFKRLDRQRKMLDGERFSRNNVGFAITQTTYKNAVILINGSVAAVGIKEITELFWSYAKDATFPDVQSDIENYGDGALETTSFYHIRNQTSTAWRSKKYWFEIDNEFKLVYAEYQQVEDLLKKN